MSFTSFSRIVGCNFSLGIAIYQIDSMSFPLGKHRSLALVKLVEWEISFPLPLPIAVCERAPAAGSKCDKVGQTGR